MSLRRAAVRATHALSEKTVHWLVLNVLFSPGIASSILPGLHQLNSNDVGVERTTALFSHIKAGGEGSDRFFFYRRGVWGLTCVAAVLETSDGGREVAVEVSDGKGVFLTIAGCSTVPKLID